MATEILAPGKTDLPSAEFTHAAGDTSTLLLKGAGGVAAGPNASVVIEAKTSTATWINIGRMSVSRPLQVLVGTGTFRVRRTAGDDSSIAGVDRS